MRPFAAIVLFALVGVVASGCAEEEASASSTADPSVPVIVTFEVAGSERFKALLNERQDVEIAHGLLAGQDLPSIPNGLVVRETGVNEGYSWSLDPADFEWADMTIEVCDGLPSDVETGTVTSDRYCPWSAVVVEVVPAP